MHRYILILNKSCQSDIFPVQILDKLLVYLDENEKQHKD